MNGDRQLIQQAVANLLDNAIKFSRPGGVVRLSAEGDGVHVRIAVRDRGIGMSAAELARASERFFRAESARSTPGSGLGLSLVQAVAQLHNGSFSLETPASGDGGLEAVLVLPLTPSGRAVATTAGPSRMEPPSCAPHDGESPAQVWFSS